MVHTQVECDREPRTVRSTCENTPKTLSFGVMSKDLVDDPTHSRGVETT